MPRNKEPRLGPREEWLPHRTHGEVIARLLKLAQEVTPEEIHRRQNSSSDVRTLVSLLTDMQKATQRMCGELLVKGEPENIKYIMTPKHITVLTDLCLRRLREVAEKYDIDPEYGATE